MAARNAGNASGSGYREEITSRWKLSRRELAAWRTSLSGRGRGFTLIELIISITLVAALATGMLMAMRTSLMSMEKINSRLMFNRRVMGMKRILTRQIGGVMPVLSDCGADRVPIFRGTSDALRLVSSYSMAEGARGYSEFDEFRVVSGEAGLRLVVTERLFTGPASTAPFCSPDFMPVDITPSSLILPIVVMPVRCSRA